MKSGLYNYIIFSSIIFFILVHYASAQFGSFFDFVNLAQSQPEFFEPFKKIKVEEAWNKINESASLRFVKVGIIDSGMDALGERHPEFRDVDLGNTPIDAKIDSEPADIPTASAGHGTQVAGIIGANNLLGTGGVLASTSPQMNGVLSGVQNLNYTLEMRRPTLLFGTVFSTDAWSVFAEINKLVGEGVDIINISNGSPYLPAIHDIWFIPTFTVLEDEVLFIVSAGNDDSDVSRFGLFDQMPANYGESFGNVITVGATIFDDTRLSFSNFGNAVNISAPGLSVYAPAPRGKGNFPADTKDYDNSFGGTSASAPMVTGVAGLIKAIKPELTPAEIKQILIESGDPISTDKPIGPRLNAEKAICHPLVLNCTPPPALGIVQGMIRFEGQPVSGALVKALDLSFNPIAETQSDVNGLYQFTIPAGEYVLGAVKTFTGPDIFGSAIGEASVGVIAGQTVNQDIDLTLIVPLSL